MTPATHLRSVPSRAAAAPPSKSRREPALPLVYLDAVRALVECRSIDEAKHWSDKSDALAAWAKIHADTAVDREARVLKLHAYRRMGQLADELRPRPVAGQGKRGGNSLLLEKGLNPTRAEAAIKIGRIPQAQFDREVESPRPKSPITLNQSALRTNPVWAMVANRMQMMLPVMRQNEPEKLVAGMDAKHLATARSNCAEILSWLEKFATALNRRGDS